MYIYIHYKIVFVILNFYFFVVIYYLVCLKTIIIHTYIHACIHIYIHFNSGYDGVNRLNDIHSIEIIEK